MDAILHSDWIGLLLVGLGTLFLLGEILVNLRGLFAVLGISFIVFYFYLFLPEPSSFVMMLIIYFIGILLILIDGKIINDGTLATLGLAGMILSVVITALTFAGLYSVIGILAGAGCSFIFLKLFKPRNMWSKITLKDRLTDEAGYSSINEGYNMLVGKTGIAMTDLRPVGTIKIEDVHYSGISNAQWIEKGQR